MRPAAATASGQWFEVKMIVRIFAWEYSESVGVLPSMPGSEKSGIFDPIGSTFGGSAAIRFIENASTRQETDLETVMMPGRIRNPRAEIQNDLRSAPVGDAVLLRRLAEALAEQVH